MAKKQPTYEEAMARLEQIVSEMEDNNLDIDRLGDALKEAKTLIAQCKEKLYKVDEEVKQILGEDEPE